MLRFAVLPLLFCWSCWLPVSTVRAADVPGGEERQLVEQVNKAIDRGVQYLRVNQNNGTWEGLWVGNVAAQLDGGVTGLATLAMLNAGVKPDAKELQTALNYLRNLPKQRTYVVALVVMVLGEARQPRDLPIIQANVDWLLAKASRSGGRIAGWSYPFTDNGQPDGSNTQYALLGLYAGKTYGAKIGDADWEQIRSAYLDGLTKQGADEGYWSYTRGDAERAARPSFTMTVAGVSGLVIAGLGQNVSRQQLDAATGVAAKCGVYDDSDALQRGLNYIGRNFTFAKPRGSDSSSFYNMYGIERVGRLTGQRFLGRVDWYREGCTYLVREQRKDGAWSASDGESYDAVTAISTSFSLLFLSKGKTPVLISKLAYGDFALPDGGTLVERGNGGVIGWNRKQQDVRNLTAFVSKELFGNMQLGWQVYDPRRKSFDRPQDVLDEAGVLVQSPILYLNGHDKPLLRGQHKEVFKKYVEEGGFVLAEACCGSPEFTRGFTELIAELFPESKLERVPPDHPIWTTFYAVPPNEFPKLMYLSRGCRSVMILSPEPLAGYWEESKYMAPTAQKQVNRGEQAFRLAGNIVAYATGMEPPAQRLTTRKLSFADKSDKAPPKGFLRPVQLRLPGETAPAPGAMRNLVTYLQTNAKLDASPDVEILGADHPDLFKYKFLYMHGRKAFTFNAAETANLKIHLTSGGLLLADACCGKPEFDKAFRTMVEGLFGKDKLVPIPLDDELFSARINGTPLTTVKRRESVAAAGADAGYADLPPSLEGVKIDGRWALIYSKFDLGCAMEGHKSTDCLGHTRDSALRLAGASVIYSLKK